MDFERNGTVKLRKPGESSCSSTVGFSSRSIDRTSSTSSGGRRASCSPHSPRNSAGAPGIMSALPPFLTHVSSNRSQAILAMRTTSVRCCDARRDKRRRKLIASGGEQEQRHGRAEREQSAGGAAHRRV